MRNLLAGIAALAALAIHGVAHAWGEPGHMLVGSIAEQILTKDGHTNAANHVQQLLGDFDLAMATTWADCARDVHQAADESFYYEPGKYTPAVCKNFSAAETARMTDYVSRNWGQCHYSKTEGCHAAYHFADVAIQHGRYDRAFVGTSEHDIVSAINAAIAVLQGDPAPAPFSIASQREALLMLAHFVGDIHQPLHVGAIYLDEHGNEVDPDALQLPLDYCEKGPTSYCTKGGNSISLGGTKNLHGSWDDISTSLNTPAKAAIVAEADRNTPQTPGALTDWAKAWASETVIEAKGAFQGITYTSSGQLAWTAQLPAGYSRTAEQKQQLERAGARLAQLLVAIWPDQ